MRTTGGGVDDDLDGGEQRGGAEHGTVPGQELREGRERENRCLRIGRDRQYREQFLVRAGGPAARTLSGARNITGLPGGIVSAQQNVSMLPGSQLAASRRTRP